MVGNGVSDAKKVTAEGASSLRNNRKAHRWTSGNRVVDSALWLDLLRRGGLPLVGERKEITFSIVTAVELS